MSFNQLNKYLALKMVSKLLGHSMMGITQASYGKLLEAKVDEMVIRLRYNQ